jgi:hypothetical protein
MHASTTVRPVNSLVFISDPEKDKIPRSLIDALDNLVRIPTTKHWEITGWYMTKNKGTGGMPPGEYLRGKNWDERRRIGIEALIDHGVLTP